MMQRKIIIMINTIIALFILNSVKDSPLRCVHLDLDHNCRLWGIVFEEKTETVMISIASHLDSLGKLGVNNPDGWGIAYYVTLDTHTVLPVIERGEPTAYNDPRYSRAKDHTIAYAQGGAIAHVRSGTSGPCSGIPDPHPFSRYAVFRSFHMFFAHNGTIDTDVLLDLLTTTNPLYLDLNPPDYCPNYLDSDLFALLVIEIIDMNPHQPIEDCIRMAITKIDSAIPMGSVQCNFVMTDGTTLWGVCYSRSPIETLSLYLYSLLSNKDFWAIASEPLDDEPLAWTSIPNSTLVVCKPNETPRFYNVLYDRPDNPLHQTAMISIHPNPAKNTIAIQLTFPKNLYPGDDITLSIYNALGQHVRTYNPVAYTSSSTHSVLWDGYDEKGTRAPPGIYCCRFLFGDIAITEKLVFLR